MARGMEHSPWVVILGARWTHKSAKSRFVGSSFFRQSIFGVEEGGGGPRNEYKKLAGGPLKEDGSRYDMDYVALRKKMKIF